MLRSTGPWFIRFFSNLFEVEFGDGIVEIGGLITARDLEKCDNKVTYRIVNS